MGTLIQGWIGGFHREGTAVLSASEARFNFFFLIQVVSLADPYQIMLAKVVLSIEQYVLT